MKRQGTIWLAAGLLALTAAGCFDDPASSLRNGPSRLELTFRAVTVTAGDSVSVIAVVKDDQGNDLPVGAASWTSADPSVAVARVDSANLAPGDIFSRAFIRGLANQAGITSVTVTAAGVTDSVRVTVLPATFPGAVNVTGTAAADTIVVNLPAPQPPLVVPYTAGDTLVLDATATLTFDAATSTVSFGAFSGYVVARTATQIKAVARQPYAGPVTVTDLIYAGDATTGPISIASLKTDSVTIGHGRYRGAVTVAASAFGPNTQMSIALPAGVSATATTGVQVGSTAAIVLARNAPAGPITAIIAGNITGSVLLTNMLIGTTAIDSLRAPALTTVNASFFPGTVANGAGTQLDTIKIAGMGLATFTTTGANASTVTYNGTQPAFILRRTADSIYAIAGVAGTGQRVSISNVLVAGTTIPSLASQSTFDITTTGDATEPANDNLPGVVLAMPANVNDTLTYFFTSGPLDADDLYSIAPGTSGNYKIVLDWTNSSADLDMYVTDAALTLNACADDFLGCAAATGADPESGTAALSAPTKYLIYVNFYAAGGAGTPQTYRLRIIRTS